MRCLTDIERQVLEVVARTPGAGQHGVATFSALGASHGRRIPEHLQHAADALIERGALVFLPCETCVEIHAIPGSGHVGVTTLDLDLLDLDRAIRGGKP